MPLQKGLILGDPLLLQSKDLRQVFREPGSTKVPKSGA